MAYDSDYNKNLPVSKVRYGKSVIRSIVILAIEEINGVASLHGKGIKINIRGNTIDIEVFIDVTFGNSCSEVAFKVQENIKDSVETMSLYKIGKINVNIVGVTFPEKIANVL